jgi:hypothetical protein
MVCGIWGIVVFVEVDHRKRIYEVQEKVTLVNNPFCRMVENEVLLSSDL